MEYTIELCVNYNDCGVNFTDDDVKEIIGEYDTSNKEEVIQKFNNLVHTIENKDSTLLNKLNDSPWHEVNEIESIEVYIYEATDEDVDQIDVDQIITKEIKI
jgi:hypothetical protein